MRGQFADLATHTLSQGILQLSGQNTSSSSQYHRHLQIDWVDSLEVVVLDSVAVLSTRRTPSIAAAAAEDGNQKQPFAVTLLVYCECCCCSASLVVIIQSNATNAVPEGKDDAREERNYQFFSNRSRSARQSTKQEKNKAAVAAGLGNN